MQHAVLFVNDTGDEGTWWVGENANWPHLLTSVQVYVGNDGSDYTLNTVCPGGPFLRDDQ